MAFVRWLLWSLCCVALGIGLAKVEIDGRTPLEHAQRLWKHKVNPSKLDQLKDSLGEAVDGARDALSRDSKPRERHSAEDREAVNKLIAKRASAK